MSVRISNGLLTAQISKKGAELSSLFHQALRLEYIWQQDPLYWAKSSPVLFPIVGALKDGRYVFEGNEYVLPRHGFAREEVFEVASSDATSATFILRDNEITKLSYPFEFELRVIYELDRFQLNVRYEVHNSSSGKMYFSIGGHPAFKVPLIEGTSFEDYFLRTEKKESSRRWSVSPEGLIGLTSEELFRDDDVIRLSHELFSNDALVFKDLRSRLISLRSHRHAHGLDFSFQGFPFFGIWSFRNADFVCLEPWCGIADSVNHDQNFVTKEGIIQLHSGESWSRSWSVSCY
jgi:galactose mutarotase-like enzyme